MPSKSASAVREPVDLLAGYVERFNLAEVEAGYLPSPTLGQFLGVLEMRDVLRSRRAARRQGDGLNASAVKPASEGEAVSPRRRRRPVVERLFNQGDLRREHLMAAEDIVDLFEALSRGMFARGRQGERVQEARATRDLIDRIGARHHRLLRDSYWPWRDWLANEPVSARFADDKRVDYASPLQLVIDIVVDNTGLRATERRYRLRNGAALAILRTCLHRYCLIAGYLHLPETSVDRGCPASAGKRDGNDAGYDDRNCQKAR